MKRVVMKDPRSQTTLSKGCWSRWDSGKHGVRRRGRNADDMDILPQHFHSSLPQSRSFQEISYSLGGPAQHHTEVYCIGLQSSKEALGKGSCGSQCWAQSAAPHMAKVHTVSNQEKDLPEAQMAVGVPFYKYPEKQQSFPAWVTPPPLIACKCSFSFSTYHCCMCCRSKTSAWEKAAKHDRHGLNCMQ